MSSEYMKPSHALDMGVPLLVQEEPHLTGNETKHNASMKPTNSNIEAIEVTGSQTTDVEYTFEGVTLPKADCTKRLLIYECSGKKVCSGLADRQTGIMSSFLLALLSNRTFSIRHTKPCPLSTYIVPNIYDWLKCLSSYNTSIDIRYVNLFYGVDTNNMPDIAGFPSGDIWKEQIVVIRTNKNLFKNVTKHASVNTTIPLLIQGTLNPIQHRLYHILFKLETSFKLEIDQYIDTITKHQARDLVGVHIRTRFINVDDDLEHIFNFVDQFNDTSKYAIYIATDSENVRQKALDRFKGSFSSNVSGIQLHVDAWHATCTTFHLASFEQQLLARSNIIVKTRSGFSLMSTYIRGRGPAFMYRYSSPTEKRVEPYFTRM